MPLCMWYSLRSFLSPFCNENISPDYSIEDQSKWNNSLVRSCWCGFFLSRDHAFIFVVLVSCFVLYPSLHGLLLLLCLCYSSFWHFPDTCLCTHLGSGVGPFHQCATACLGLDGGACITAPYLLPMDTGLIRSWAEWTVSSYIVIDSLYACMYCQR